MANISVKSFTAEDLQHLSEENAGNILTFLLERVDKTKAWILNKNTTQREEVLFLDIVKTVVSSNSERNRTLEFLSLVSSSHYIEKLHKLLSNISKDENRDFKLHVINDIVHLLSTCYTRLPSSMLESLGLLQVVKTQISDDLECVSNRCDREKLEALRSLYDDAKMLQETILKDVQLRQKDRKMHQKPPDDFRKMSIYPRNEDIFITGKPFLRKILSRGSFDDLNHYLDVQFRLLREDYISPLRDGIVEYIALASSKGEEGVRRLQEVHLYKNVKSIEKETSMEGMIYTILMDSYQVHKINWQRCKRLLYGSLLCLSSDNFRTMYFATVCDRNRISETNTIQIRIEQGNSMTALPAGVTFTMLESTVFFEPYRCVLECLQKTYDGDLPFERYIVKCCDRVFVPKYLRENASAVYDLYPLMSNSKISLNENRISYSLPMPRKTTCQTRDVDILSGFWPEAENLHLDKSQYEAFKAALTEEIVIIQGPPGTGKTYLGLQIAKALLHNRKHWISSWPEDKEDETDSHPMLVVCYTNHALDQFLEGVVNFFNPNLDTNFPETLIRVGGQCKSSTIEKFSLQRRRQCTELRTNTSEIKQQLQNNHEKIAKLKWKITNSRSVILGGDILATVIPQVEFLMNKQTDKSVKYIIARWLGIDEQSWLNSAKKAYESKMFNKFAIDTNSTSSTEVIENAVNNEEPLFVNLETEEEQAIRNRRIEEDEFETNYTFNENLGLDIDDELNKILDDSNYSEEIKHLLRIEAKKSKDKLSLTDRMTEEEAERTGKHLWRLTKINRWRLYRLWLQQYRETLQNDIKESENKFAYLYENYKKEKQKVDKTILRQASVIGMTTTGAARYQDVLREIGPKIVIVEEAAEVLEGHIVATLSSKCEHLILIGDHKQLEPKPAVYELSKKYNLSLSLFERMINNDVRYHCLEKQHRMRPEISKLVRHIYHRLVDNENVFSYDNIKGVGTNLFFLTHEIPENYKEDGKTYSNQHEANFLMRFCNYLLQQGYSSQQITILTPYSGQLFCIRNLLPRKDFEGVRISILDNYQGEENDVILLSLVRSNKEMRIGFLDRENRVCVALSRAKIGLFVIGNFHLMTGHIKGSKIWSKIISNLEPSSFGKDMPLKCQNHPAKEHHVKTSDDFDQAPDGGCSEKCDFRLLCGHACRLFCHPYDREHKEYECKKQCLKRCKMNHVCRKRCHYPIPCSCDVIVKKHLSLCEHSAKMACCFPPEDYTCRRIVERHLPCGHVMDLACHIDFQTIKCDVIVTKILPKCEHEKEMMCGTDINHYSVVCSETVLKTLLCGHEMLLKCSVSVESISCSKNMFPYTRHIRATKAKDMCKEMVSKIIPHCGHSAMIMCFEDPRTIKCQTIVEKNFGCSHPVIKIECHKSATVHCEKICDKVCERNHICKETCHYPSSCNCQVLVNKTLPNCGHEKEMPCSTSPYYSLDCLEPVNKTLLCGHKMELKCSFPVTLVLCSENLKVSAFRSIHVDVKKKQKCNATVLKMLPCGHETEMKCSSLPQTTVCVEKVTIQLESCGHSKVVKCFEKKQTDTHVCKELVETTLPCGHQIMKYCNKPMKDIKCSVIVRIVCSDCHHKADIECQNIPIHTCKRMVRKTNPVCGHEKVMECFKDPKSDNCSEVICTIHPVCKHAIKIRCSENEKLRVQAFKPDSKGRQIKGYTFPRCTEIVDAILFCGKQIKVECWRSETVLCSPNTKCHKPLHCGHSCSSCVKCKSGMLHVKCQMKCQKILFCGHLCKSPTCGSCGACDQMCPFRCVHKACKHPCSNMCLPCRKRCTWNCPHHKCNSLCYETCDRPRCNQRCQKSLQCGHNCMGFCGEPCPALCKICHIYMLKLITSKNIEDVVLVELQDCKHVFESGVLDKYMDEVSTDYVNIKQCPKCQNPITMHPRYNNVLKQHCQTVNSIRHQTSLMPGEIKRLRFPLISVSILNCRTYIEHCMTYLDFNEQQITKNNVCLYRSARYLLDDCVAFIDMIQHSRNPTAQNYIDIYRAVRKVCALWLLFAYIASNTDIEDQTHDEFQEERENDKELIFCRSDSKTLRQDLILEAIGVIKSPGIFTERDMEKVEQICTRAVQNGSTPERWTRIAKSYPRLPTSIDVHQESWKFCDKGHIFCTLCDDLAACWRCSGMTMTSQQIDALHNRESGAITRTETGSGSWKRDAKKSWIKKNTETEPPMNKRFEGRVNKELSAHETRKDYIVNANDRFRDSQRRNSDHDGRHSSNSERASDNFAGQKRSRARHGHRERREVETQAIQDIDSMEMFTSQGARPKQNAGRRDENPNRNKKKWKQRSVHRRKNITLDQYF